MLSFILKFFLFHFSGRSQNKLVMMATEVISLLATLYVFSVSNRLISPSAVEGEARDYFQFLLIGEIALLLPISLFEALTRNYLDFQNSLFLHTLKGIQIPFFPVLLHKSIAELFFPILRVLMMLVLSKVFFNFHFSPEASLLFIVIQVLSMVAMSLLAKLVIQLHINYQKGLKLIYMLNSFLVVLGGAYFPVKFLPELLGKYLLWLFPQSFILLLSRMAFNDNLKATLLSIVYFIFYVLVMRYITMMLVRFLKKRHRLKLFAYVTLSESCNLK